MIDGVKIELPLSIVDTLLKRLTFYSFCNEQTGEIDERTRLAKYKGLLFVIKKVKDKKTGKYKLHECYFRGSLHKFYNNGKHNNNTFTFDNLQDVINELQRDFYINPSTAILHNLELGLNIYTPITASKFLKSLVAYKNYQFDTLKSNACNIGYEIRQQRQRLKIYNKGKQSNIQANNLIRIEIAFKKMFALKDFDIKTMSDLTNPNKLQCVFNLLLEWWDNIIFYDNSINYRHLSEFDREKLLVYENPKKWQKFNRTQRKRAKKHFFKLMQQHGSTIQQDIHNILCNKWAELSAEKCTRFNRPQNGIYQQENVHVLTLINEKLQRVQKGVNIDPQKLTIFTPKIPPKKTHDLNTKKRQCKVCKNNIEHKKANAKYCSKKCNNKFNGLMRTKRNQKRIETEKKNLNKLLKVIERSNLILTISYTENNITYSETLGQKEICTSNEIIKTVSAVCLFRYGKFIELRSYRARRLIKAINRLNFERNNKKVGECQKKNKGKIKP